MNLPTVLLYHQVKDLSKSEDSKALAVSPARFEQQMKFLYQHNYQNISLESMVEAVLDEKKTPSKSFAITFDDGYKDILEYAFPILKKYGFTATVFLVADKIGASSDWNSRNSSNSYPLLSEKEIKELQNQGIQFESHSYSHRFMDDLNEDEIILELNESKTRLEELTCAKIKFFSYPYFTKRAEIQQLVRSCGYTAAFAASFDLPHSLFNLWRIECRGDDSMLDFFLKVSGKRLMLAKWKRKIKNRVLNIR